MIETYRKLLALLTPRERRRALMLLALMLVVSLVEVAGVASIFPLLAVLANPSVVETNALLHWLYTGLGFTSTNGFLIFLSVAVFFVVVGRAALTALSNYAIVRFSYMRGFTLGSRLLATYLSRNYSWFLERHSAEHSKAVFSEVGEVIQGSLLPALQLIAQAAVAASIILLVVAIDPLTALVATATLGGAYGVIYIAIRRRLRRLGRERVAANADRFRIVQEAFGGIKEVKVGGLETAYLKRFERAAKTYEQRRSTLQIMGELPRHALEALAVGGILLVIVILLFRSGGTILAVLPAIGVYAFAGMRLLMVVQVIYKSLTTIRASGPALDRLAADLRTGTEMMPSQRPPKMVPRNAIELRNVSFSYSGAGRTALTDVTLSIPVNTTVGFVGQTGAGKSTIVDIVLGLLEPQRGQLLVDGTAIGPTNRRSWQGSIGYVPQHIFLADESLVANIAFGVPAEQIDMGAVERAVRMANLTELVAEMPKGMATLVGERGVRLSGGQRQRVGIARALYHDPEVLVFDEATSALDTLTEQAVMEAVRGLSRQKTIIMIAHRLTTIQGCDTIFVLDHGKLVEQGDWQMLMSRQGHLSRLAG